jgi:hypothetical protein
MLTSGKNLPQTNGCLPFMLIFTIKWVGRRNKKDVLD